MQGIRFRSVMGSPMANRRPGGRQFVRFKGLRVRKLSRYEMRLFVEEVDQLRRFGPRKPVPLINHGAG